MNINQDPGADGAADHITAQPGPLPAAPRKPGKVISAIKSLGITKFDIVITLLALNLMGLGTVAYKVHEGVKPQIVTVGVRQLTAEYVAKIATSGVNPEVAAAKTQMFLAVAQDLVRQSAADNKAVVMARECVLAGQYTDITHQVAADVEKTLSKAGAGLGQAAPSGALAPPALPAGAP